MTLSFEVDMAESDAFSQANWADVLSAMDAAYAELLDNQTRLERQNEELHETRRLLSSIFASIHDVMAVLDRDGRIVETSISFAQAVAPAKAEGAFADHLPEVHRARFAEVLAELKLRRTPPPFEAELAGPAGAAPFEFALSPRLTDRGRVLGAVVLGRPLGELRRAYRELEEGHERLKQAQAQLVRNEKLAGLGRLLAGVAHELNNPISFVYANAHALERYVERFEAYFARVAAGASRAELVALREDLKLERALANLRDAIDGARDGSERVRDIVDDLRRLSSEGGGQAERFDLAAVSRVAARWVERGSKSRISPGFEGLESLVVSGNPGHVQQIVMNLVQNAMDALDGVEAPRLTIDIAAEGATAVLRVRDNGPGVPEAAAASIFDPFFTTKAVGAGTGLGLAISHKIAEEHGGGLTLEPSAEGAVFRLALPLESAA